MKKSLTYCFCMLAISMLFQTSFGQQMSIGLEECLGIARAKSPAAEIAKAQFESSYYDFKAYRAGLKPGITINGSFPGLFRSINSILQNDGTQIFIEQNQMFSSVGLTISQVIPWSGGRISVRSSLSQLIILDDQTSETTSYQTVPLSIAFSQPLLRFNNLKWDKKLAPLRYHVAEMNYLQELEQGVLNISQKYFEVYIAEMRLQNSETNLLVNDSIYQISKGRFNVGKIAENDLLQSELGWLNSKTEVELFKLEYQQAIQDLQINLGLDADIKLEILPPGDIPVINVNEEFAIEHGVNHNSIFHNAYVNQLEAEGRVRQARANTRPTADLDATFGYNQSASSIQGAYQEPLQSQMATISFSVPIFQWGRARAQLHSALANQKRVVERTELDKKTFRQQVRFQVKRFKYLQSQVLLAAKSDTIAYRRFDVAKNRYLIGRISITDLQNAQREKDNSRQAYYRTLSDFWSAYFNIRKSTLFNFIEELPLTIPDNIFD